jgi:hypothetical protein
MPNSELHLGLFAFATTTAPTERLEARLKRFLEQEPTSESLDSDEFSELSGGAGKADYLLAKRHFIAELKTINGNPKDRVEQRLKSRFAQPGSPIVFGQYGLTPVLSGMPDERQLVKMINDVCARSVRRHLQKSNDQVAFTRAQLGLNSAAGLSIILNDSEPMVDVANIGYAIRAAINSVEGGYLELSYVWVNVECHRVKMPDGTEGFPQLLVWRSYEKLAELDFLIRMLSAWAQFNGSMLHQLQHNGDWDSMRPIFDGGPPVLEMF